MTRIRRPASSRGAPPRVAEGLLERALGKHETSAAILGDLAEEHEDLLRRSGERAADRWYWCEALRLVARVTLRRASASEPQHHAARPRSQERNPMTHTLRNLRLAARSLRRQPLFAIAVVTTVAVALGANTAVFSVLDAIVLRPLPVPDADRLAVIWGTVPDEGLDRRSLSPADFLDLRQRARSLERLEAYTWWDANLSGDGPPVGLQGALTTPGFLDLLGVRPALGSSLADVENERARTVVLSRRLFEDRFGADPSAIGSTIRLDGEAYEVVGVAPAGFNFPWGADLWAPLQFDPETAADRDTPSLEVIGRLSPRVTHEAASDELVALTADLERTYPTSNRGKRARAVPLAVGVRDLGAPAFLTSWQVAVLCVLLMACVNVAGLLVARGHERQRELALQLALGSGRMRLVAQLLTESLVLVAVGAWLALPLAAWGLDLIRAHMPPEVARFVVGWSQIDLDRRVLLVSAGAALLTALLAGLAPALRATGRGLEGTLREGKGGGGPKRQRARGALIGCEVALALTLLVTATLVVRGTLRLTQQNPGFEPDGVLAFEVSLPEESYGNDVERLRFFEEARERIASIAGVEAAALVNTLPASGNVYQPDLELEGDEARAGASKTAFSRVVTPDYLATLRIPLLQGRALAESDRADTTRVALVSQGAARRFWPDQSPLGKRLRFTSSRDDAPWLEVVGVVGDVTQAWFEGPGTPMVYQALAQTPRLSMGFAVKASGDPLTLVPQVQNAIRSIAPDQPIDEVSTLPRMIYENAVGLRYASAIMAVFGVIAAILAAIGLYGLMAFAVGQRMRELGVRVALGAGRADVLQSAVGRPVIVVAVGTVAGLLLAFAAASWMSGVMFGLVIVEPVVFAALALLLLAVAALAALGPARRALRVDPATTLRAE